MKKSNLTGLLIGLVVFGMVGSVQAASIIFSDNFDSESIGIPATGLIQWNIVSGSVDVIGTGSAYNYFTSYGKYLDMDGLTNAAGKITTKQSFTLQPGNYTLSYDLAGNQRNNNTDYVYVGLGTFVDAIQSLTKTQGFQTFTNNFSVTAATTVSLSFAGAGGDNIGMLLDNVVLSGTSNPVPVPAAVWLLGSGLAGLVTVRRKIAKK